PEQTEPNVGGLPQSKPLVQPSFSNQAKLSMMSDTFRIGVTACASMVVLPARGRVVLAEGPGRHRGLERVIGRKSTDVQDFRGVFPRPSPPVRAERAVCH